MMREIIRFAWGTSSLGDFVVAMSAEGIVALEFSSLRTVTEEVLRTHFPLAKLEHSPDELARVITIVAGLIDDPSADCDLPLDLRGTPHEVKVWLMLREISVGQTTTYSALAAKLGSQDPRKVTAAIAKNPVAVIVPCHRVIRKDGSISGYRWGVRRKRSLLAREKLKKTLVIPDTSSIVGGAFAIQGVAATQRDPLQSESLSESLAVIRLSLQSVEGAKQRFPDYRLTKLVSARFNLDEFDLIRLTELLGDDVFREVSGTPRPFNDHLRYVIRQYRLEAHFSDDGYAPYHHAIRPTGYDFDRNEVIPNGMEKWRADYRAMSDERQMLAASIIWLYRAGKDNIWLRRVPCTWHAADAIACMKATGVFPDWVRLFALYPGW